ncbi:MAG: DUF1326 domain-containing protein [Euryarchaeota archaeon]|nr:DUF1326 domain-containing protein [Euryarchaeota archaeon]MDE1837742.1 DUF1326 domain-containing protein [Euryarchaeota archaeon]MDE2046095.1 DUF1326 domain-containing protein [Thermoplasmata archaeon]
MAPPKWNFEAEYIQSCNCDYGCPCNFNGYPSYGNCEALVAWKIRKGQFGSTKLDGAIVATGMWFPGALHEGNGTAAAYFDPSTTPDQREALGQILTGKVGGGFFEIAGKIVSRFHAPKVAKIDFHFDGYDSWFTVDGVGEVRSTHILNPVTKQPFEGSIKLPGGIIFKDGLVTGIRKWWLKDEDLLSHHENKNGHVAVVKFNETGCVG